jgi:hypothetical protein
MLKRRMAARQIDIPDADGVSAVQSAPWRLFTFEFGVTPVAH